MIRTAVVWVLLAATLLSACTGMLRNSAASESERLTDYAGEPIDSFNTFGLDSWSAVGRDRLIVWDGPSRAYLIVVREPCSELKFAESVAVTSTLRSVSKFESVRVGRDRCPINEIRPIDVKQMRVDRAARAAMESSQAAPAPAPTPAQAPSAPKP